MAADKRDEPGVLGNLPRSRPGHRSDKRTSTARGGAANAAATRPRAEAAPSSSVKAPSRKTSAKGAKPAPAKAAARARKPAAAKPAAAAARARKPAAAKPTAAAARTHKPAAAKPAPTARRPQSAPPPELATRRAPERGGTDPLTGAVRLAGNVAEAGLKTARGLLKRLPGR